MQRPRGRGGLGILYGLQGGQWLEQSEGEGEVWRSGQEVQVSNYDNLEVDILSTCVNGGAIC